MNPQALIAAAKKERRTALDEIAGKQLLASFGVTVPKSVITPSFIGRTARRPSGVRPIIFLASLPTAITV